MMIPGCKETGRFNFEQGGKQGGVETPDIFNCCLEMIMSPLIESWVEKGWGVRLAWDETDKPTLINHAVWADNIWLVAECPKILESMFQELTDAIYSASFAWKLSSLEVMA